MNGDIERLSAQPSDDESVPPPISAPVRAHITPDPDVPQPEQDPPTLPPPSEKPPTEVPPVEEPTAPPPPIRMD